jgi:ion channel-forming bestrophin family protein
MWCGTLPFALVGSLGVAMLPVVTIACWALFGIEELGHLIEQPFVPHTSSRVVRAAGERPETIFWRGPETYDFSIPVETLAASVRADVWAVASSMRGEAVGA